MVLERFEAIWAESLPWTVSVCVLSASDQCKHLAMCNDSMSNDANERLLVTSAERLTGVLKLLEWPESVEALSIVQ